MFLDSRTGFVYKEPTRLGAVAFAINAQRERENSARLRETFGEFALPTEVLSEGNRWAVRSPYFPGRRLLATPASYQGHKDEIEALILADAKMRRDGLAYDFLGQGGITTGVRSFLRQANWLINCPPGYWENVLVADNQTRNPRLGLIDNDIFDLTLPLGRLAGALLQGAMTAHLRYMRSN